MLAALAAQKGGATDGTTVQKNLMAVSGSTKGKECDSYKACLALLKDGKEIQYKGQTSIGAFNDAHDPSSASIGVYKYDADQQAGLRPLPGRFRTEGMTVGSSVVRTDVMAGRDG